MIFGIRNYFTGLPNSLNIHRHIQFFCQKTVSASPSSLSFSLSLSTQGTMFSHKFEKRGIRKKVNTKRDLKRCFLGYGLRESGLPRLTLCRITFTAGIICQFPKCCLLICICCLIPNSCKSSNMNFCAVSLSFLKKLSNSSSQ